VAFSGFAVARNVARYLDAFPEAAGHIDAVCARDLQVLRAATQSEYSFAENTPTGIQKTLVKQAESLDEYARKEGLPVEWRKIHRLGLEPVQVCVTIAEVQH
jgi:hypothetical protein